MIRDITIGQYYPAKSVLHRLDPRTKFLGTLGFLISVFLFHTFLGYAVATVFLVAMIAISKVPVKFMFKGLKAIVMILLITVVFNIILTPGEVLWRFGIIKVTKEGLVLAGRMAIEIALVIVYVIKSSIFQGGIQKVLNIFNLSGHYENFTNGVFDVTGIVYFISVIAICLFLTMQSIQKRRWN